MKKLFTLAAVASLALSAAVVTSVGATERGDSAFSLQAITLADRDDDATAEGAEATAADVRFAELRGARVVIDQEKKQARVTGRFLDLADASYTNEQIFVAYLNTPNGDYSFSTDTATGEISAQSYETLSQLDCDGIKARTSQDRSTATLTIPLNCIPSKQAKVSAFGLVEEGGSNDLAFDVAGPKKVIFKG